MAKSCEHESKYLRLSTLADLLPPSLQDQLLQYMFKGLY